MKVAIIGGGFSGAFTALQLVKQDPNVKVEIVSEGHPLGTGLAYSTLDDNFLLNVPTGNMSAFPDQPNHFKEYCERIDGAVGSAAFVSRRLYGEYLQYCLREEGQDRITHHVRRASSVNKLNSGRYIISTDNDYVIHADRVVLALGHFPPKSLHQLLNVRIPQHLHVLDNPWDFAEISKIKQGSSVVIVGTGHTAIDTFFRLESSGICDNVMMISRHGLLPNGHRPIGEFHKDPDDSSYVQAWAIHVLSTHGLQHLFRAIRKLPSTRNVNWRDIINALRPVTPRLWSMMDTRQRRQFLRHVVPYWDTHRHRLSPSANTRLQRAIEDGRLTIIGGRIEGFDSYKMYVQHRHAEAGDFDQIAVDYLINCSGPTYDLRRLPSNNILRKLYLEEVIKLDPVQIGLEVDENYRVNAESHPGLFYVGPMLKAKYWEAIAVPELRIHAQKAATSVLNSFKA